MHYHTQNTELFYIISGQGVMETPEGEKPLSPGTVAVCPPGEKSAHRSRNTSEKEALVYLDVDTANSPDIIHYPETGKTGIILHTQSCTFFKDSSQVSYYSGEEEA